MQSSRHPFALCIAAALLIGVMAVAMADGAAARHRPRMMTDPDLDAALVIDAKSGQVLYARHADAVRHPASLTKMMTLYLLFEDLRAHRIALSTPLSVSSYAARQPRSHIHLRAGNTISVDMAIKAIVVGSANDAAVAVAENLSGSEDRFAARMTARARALGMAHTNFHNATGLPDELQLTTAEDLVILARHLVYDFPEYYGYFRTTQMEWRGEEYTTHNSLLVNYAGADGIKTGYIDASGYNLVGTAERGGRRLIAVVMGGLTAEKRDEEITELLDATFETAMMDLPPVDAAPAAAPARPPTPAVTVPPVTTPAGAHGAALLGALVADPSSPFLWGTAVIAAELTARSH